MGEGTHTLTHRECRRANHHQGPQEGARAQPQALSKGPGEQLGQQGAPEGSGRREDVGQDTDWAVRFVKIAIRSINGEAPGGTGTG
jgi:hypothetical protein